MGIARIRHALRPDVEAASLGWEIPAVWDFPVSPDAFAFVESLIKYVVLGKIALGPMALAIGRVILAPDDKFADHIATLARHIALAEGEEQVHKVAARDQLLKKIAGPGSAGETGVGFEGCLVGHGHGLFSREASRTTVALRVPWLIVGPQPA